MKCKCGNNALRGKDVCLACFAKQDADRQRSKPKHIEDDIQAEFFFNASILFPKLDKLLYHACNEGKRDPKRAKRIGIKSGVADVHLAIANHQYHSLYIEFKAGKNTQTDEQIEFQKQVEAAGNKYVVCYLAAEAIEILKEYLKTGSYK